MRSNHSHKHPLQSIPIPDWLCQPQPALGREKPIPVALREASLLPPNNHSNLLLHMCQPKAEFIFQMEIGLLQTNEFSPRLSRNTSTLRTSLSVCSVSLLISAWTMATWSLLNKNINFKYSLQTITNHAITLPNAESLSSIRLIWTESGKLFRICCNSWSVVAFGTKRPWRLPTVILPTIRIPAIVQWITGIVSANSASRKLNIYNWLFMIDFH